MDQEYKEIDIVELLAPIRAHWIKILFASAVGALAALLLSIYVLTPKYQASAMLIVNSNQSETALTSISNDAINSAKALVNTYSVILKGSTEMLEGVIETLGLDMTASQLSGMLSAASKDNTQVMVLTLTHTDPAQAQAILHEIVLRAPETLIEAVRAGSVKIISPAQASDRPVSPNIKTNTAIGFGAGLIIALAFVYIRKFLKNTFITDDDVSRELGLPVLGVIPKIKIEG